MTTTSQEDLVSSAKQIISKHKNGDFQIMKLQQEFDEGGDCLAHKKSEFSQVKLGLLELEARLAFLRNLREDPSCWPCPEDTDKHLEDLSANLSASKEENAGVKEEINNSVEAAEEALDQFESKVKELELKTDELDKARAQLEAVKKKNKVKKTHDIARQQEKESELHALEKACEASHRMLASRRQELDRLKIICANKCREKQLKLETMALKGEHYQGTYSGKSRLSRGERALQTLLDIDNTRLQVHKSDHSKLVIEFQGQGQGQGQSQSESTHSTSLFLNIQLKQKMDGSQVITNAMANDDAFPFRDLLESEGHSLPAFVHRIQERWQQYQVVSEPTDPEGQLEKN